MMLQALRDEVIVRAEEEERTKSGLYLVKNMKDNNTGTVISLGPRCPYKDLKPGDTIKYRTNEGIRFKYKGVLYLKLKAKWVEAKEGA